MKEQFTTMAIAAMVFAKGFNEPCLAFFNGGPEHLEPIDTDFVDFQEVNECQKAPLWQQVIDWFRVTHKIEIYVIEQIEEDEFGGIVCYSKVEEFDEKICAPTYYEARIKSIEYALTLI